jgi:uncharacterized protein (DUF849 family)
VRTVNVLQVCLNGARTRAEHAGLPVSPAELATAARAAVAAGAEDIHLHPKTPDGNDSLAADVVGAAVMAVRAAVPGVTVGVTTGAWTAPDPSDRVGHIRGWSVLPDHASVNWHEDGAEDVAMALLDMGVAVHAGIFSGTLAPGLFRRSPLAGRVARILAEIVPPAVEVDALLDALTGLGPILLHGEDEMAWPVLRRAQALGLDTRVGLEDTLTLPDGSPASDNAALVRAALVTSK